MKDAYEACSSMYNSKHQFDIIVGVANRGQKLVESAADITFEFDPQSEATYFLVDDPCDVGERVELIKELYLLPTVLRELLFSFQLYVVLVLVALTTIIVPVAVEISQRIQDVLTKQHNVAFYQV